MDIEVIIFIVIAGSIGGYLSGLLGVGGGIIFVPVLDYLFLKQGVTGPEQVKFILANSFLIILFTGLISSYRQKKNKNFFGKEIIFAAIPAAVVGVSMSYWISSSSWFDDDLFKIIFVALIVLTTIRKFFYKPPENQQDLKTSTENQRLTISGGLAGLVSAVSGLGGGVLLIPLLTGYLRYPMKKAASISIGIIPLLVLPSVIAYGMSEKAVEVANYQLGYLTMGWLIPMLPGIFVFAQVGVNHARKLSNHILQLIFAILVGIIAIKTIIQLI